ncbi:hypothetical protein KGP26_00820 [Serratia sp. JSRIV002]|uniref:hypothetical protein n=1 Tax=Serratia sp. JSRIV002 TaxID=2831894 RepID=UPI001CC0B24F|nr:hypothetical protein [Serratia sp. JSRIV002]UAN51672.1 hypothetical protein KGP26_00820 [Serratia sp. JSRIV002]
MYERDGNILKCVIETLAGIEHERWAKWQCYLHSKCIRNADGSLTIPAEFVLRWEKQLVTPYGDLSEIEKQSDRELISSDRLRYLGVMDALESLQRNAEL